jgi:hypothetical protein
VPLTGEEIRARLSVFAARWSVYEGSERSEAQTFLNELFECYGTHRQDVARFEEPQAGRFLDLIWPRVCVIEMKAPKEAKQLAKHRTQAFDYWRDSSDPDAGIPAAQYVVICAFRRLEIWEPGAYPNAPRAVLDLIDLPDQYDALLFLAGRDAVFAGGQATLTREAVVHITDLYEQVKERRAADPDVLRDFVLQSVWCLFAEDLGQIPEHRFTQIVDDLVANPHRSSADDIGGLFDILNDTTPVRPAQGQYEGVPYANGGLFDRPAHVHLSVPELEHLRDAAKFNWRLVEPAIFGSLLEGGLGHDKQWALGAHYTHEADIQKVVQPTIVEPWRERIENISTHKEALAAQNDLLNYVVLDQACGSGNFLYVAYRELRRLEKRLHEREVELRKKAGMKEQESISLHFPLQNMRGVEIDGFAVALARVTLWMGHKLAIDELNLTEATLPLADLSGIQVADALRVKWPRAEAIIGNPPFHGTKFMRSILGDDYVEWLRREFGIGVKDYCVYWFRRAYEQLAPGSRAGLVGTNSIAEGKNREASLDYIVAEGGVITNAVSSQDWPGEANVHVSIVNWVKEPPEQPKRYVLDAVDVDGIATSLRGRGRDLRATALKENRNRQFFGVVQTGSGFILSDGEAAELHARKDADYRDVVKRFLVGDDITSSTHLGPRRWIIDFGEMSLEEAMRYPAALTIVRDRVKPHRDKHSKRRERLEWWKFSRTVQDLFHAVEPLRRFVACPATAKRFFMIWCDAAWVPSNAVSAFAFDDDGSMGVLISAIHSRWATVQSTKLETRPRYTVASFARFPWPVGQLSEVARIAESLVSRRGEICVQQNVGLTKLYNEVEDGAWTDLRDLHEELDEAVAAAYGWQRKVAHDADETNSRLLELNRGIAAGHVPYDPFARLR